MNRKTWLPCGAAVAVWAGVAACSDSQGPRAIQAKEEVVAVSGTPELSGSDHDLAELARSIPGLGGVYLESNAVHVTLKDLTKVTAASVAIRSFLSKRGEPKQRTIFYHGARYGFLELLSWKALARPALTVTGVTYLDINESKNSLRFGIAREDVRPHVLAVTRARGIPNAAVEFELSEGFTELADVRSSVRPTLGGLRITTLDPLKQCTLGFDAIQNGVRIFVTNSHCTNIQGGVEGTSFGQPIPGPKQPYAGFERADPTYFTGSPCPSGMRCRYSDAASATYTSQVSSTLEIALTTVVGSTGPGSFTIASRVPVQAKAAAPLLGLVVRKTGQASGTTQGPIAVTCADTPVTGTNIVLLCQNYVDAYSIPGDSGSPVWSVGGQNTLHGILWSGNVSHTRFGFSSLGAIEQELGTMTVF